MIHLITQYIVVRFFYLVIAIYALTLVAQLLGGLLA